MLGIGSLLRIKINWGRKLRNWIKMLNMALPKARKDQRKYGMIVKIGSRLLRILRIP